MVVNQRDNLAMARDRQVAERAAASGFQTGSPGTVPLPRPHLSQPLPGAATFPGGTSHQFVLVSSGSLGHHPPRASSQPQLQHKYLSQHWSPSPPTWYTPCPWIVSAYWFLAPHFAPAVLSSKLVGCSVQCAGRALNQPDCAWSVGWFSHWTFLQVTSINIAHRAE